MKKAVIITTLLVLVITLLFLPNYPALHYYIEKITISNADNDINLENTNSLIGDFKYIAAISKRASDINNKKESDNTPPKTNKNTSNIIYLLFENNALIDVPGSSLNYFDIAQKIHIRYIPVNTPPPVS